VEIDFVSKFDYLLILLPEVVLSTAAIALLLGDVFQRKGEGTRSAAWVGTFAAVSVAVAAVANAFLLTAEVTAGTVMIGADAFRVTANFIFLGATFFGLLFSYDWLEREGLDRGEFYVLVLLATVGMMVLGAARDLIVVFLGLELMSIAVYVLTGFHRSDPRSSEAGLKYFLIGAFASAFLLFGIAFLYGATGSTNLAEVVPRVAEAAESGNVLLYLGIGLLLIGFGFKISAVPFHMWTPDAYEGAPTPVTGYMAAGVKAAAFAALLRVLTVELAPAADAWQVALWWVAVLTMVVPNLVALAQDDVKRMLAYSSVAHAGYLLVGVVSANAMGRSAALFYLAVYTLMTLGSFAVVYHVAGKGDRRSHLSDFAGLGWKRPLVGVAMVIFLLSLAGFPPTGGFVGKLYLLRAAVEADQVGLAVTLVLTSLVAYYYYLRVVWKMYFEEAPEETPTPGRPGRAFRVSAGVCAAGILLLGLLPGVGIDAAERAGRSLGERPPAAERPAPTVPATTTAERTPRPARTGDGGRTAGPAPDESDLPSESSD